VPIDLDDDDIDSVDEDEEEDDEDGMISDDYEGSYPTDKKALTKPKSPPAMTTGPAVAESSPAHTASPLPQKN